MLEEVDYSDAALKFFRETEQQIIKNIQDEEINGETSWKSSLSPEEKWGDFSKTYSLYSQEELKETIKKYEKLIKNYEEKISTLNNLKEKLLGKYSQETIDAARKIITDDHSASEY